MTTHPPTEHRAPITIVTAFFALDKSNAPRPDGRTPSDYHQWMANFLPVINWPLVVFCDAQSLDTIKRLRGDKPAVYHITRFEDFSVYRHRRILRAHIAQRWPGFPADLSLVYHEKAHFVRRAIDENHFGSDMFFWSDIGMFRVPKRRAMFQPSARIEWPNRRVCRAFGNQVAFFAATDAVRNRARPWVLGTVWGGRAGPARRFCDDYYRFLNRRMRANLTAPGRAVPKGMGYHSEEAIINPMSESGDFNMRVFATDDIRWLYGLGRLAALTMPASSAPNCNPQSPPPPQNREIVSPRYMAYLFVPMFYCLNGGRFPWAELGREVSVSAAARLAANIIRRRIKSFFSMLRRNN